MLLLAASGWGGAVLSAGIDAGLTTAGGGAFCLHQASASGPHSVVPCAGFRQESAEPGGASRVKLSTPTTAAMASTPAPSRIRSRLRSMTPMTAPTGQISTAVQSPAFARSRGWSGAGAAEAAAFAAADGTVTGRSGAALQN